MTKKLKILIFIFCFVLFALLAPLAVFYAQGYRYDFENKRVTQTGGLFIKTTPKQVSVFLNYKEIKKTDLFFGSVFIDNLLPKNYKVEVKKEGYHSWEKTLEIKEKEVQEAKNVTLFPADLSLNSFLTNLNRVWFSPDYKKLILEEKEKTGWALKLYDFNKKLKIQLLDEDSFLAKDPKLINLTFTEDAKKLNLEISIKEKIHYFTLEIDRPTTLTETTPPVIPVKNTIAFKKLHENLYYLDTLGYLFKNDTKLNSDPFPLQEETKYTINIFQDYLLLQEDYALYQFNYTTQEFETIFQELKDIKIAPDNRKFAFFSQHEIWLFYLDDKYDPPQRSAGEKVLLIRSTEPIENLFWLNDHYLVFQTDNYIKITETDNRDHLNLINIFEIKNSPFLENPLEMFWNSLDKKLYFLSGETLYQSTPLLF